MMVRKKLAVLVAALGALQSGAVSALGLGDISLNSALNQPMQAEIKLLDTGDLDPSQVLVKLGAKEDFDRAGVSRDFFLSNMRFSVEIGDDGKGVIKIKTRESVLEPYLDFIVEARWPSGRILREYTVLLDLPTYSAIPAPTVTAAPVITSNTPSLRQASVSKSSQKKRDNVSRSSTAGTSARESLRQGDLNPGENYRVQRDETLWEISAKSKPAGHSVQKAMLGIQRLNPQAFIKGNINRLKAGYVLRLPTDADIRDISEGIAQKEVANQNQAWKTGVSKPSMMSNAPLDASAPTAYADERPSEDSRLSITGSGSSTGTGSEGAGSGSGSAAYSEELDAAEERLDQTTRHNEELAGRLNDMEAKMATLQRILDLKEDQLAVLQATKSDSLDSASSTPTIVSPTPNPILETETEAAPEPVASKSKPEPSFVDELLGNPIYWGAAGGVIALAVIALMLRRRKQSEDEDDLDLASTFAEEPELDELSDLPLAEDDLDVSMVTEDEISTESEFELDDASVGDFADDDVVEDDIVEPQAPIQSETGDAIAEADIYIAYGRFQQAMDLLKSAHTQEPQRSDVLVKLLEVCLESRDKPDFQEHYVKLKSLGDEGAIIQVKEMLSTVDGAEDWLDGLPGSAPNITDADMDAELIEGQDESLEGIDSDLDDDLLVANSTLEFDAIDISLDDDGIELDLDLDLEGDDLDELSENRTMQFDTTMLDEKLGDGEPLATSLGLDESSDELSSELSSLDTDSGEIDLGDLELDSLDLEGDFDLDDGLDIDLEDGLDTALESGDTADSDEIMSLDTEEELDLSADLELAVDLESDDLALDSLETAGDLTSEDSLELDLSDDFGDLELSAELEELEPELEESNEEEALDVSLDIAAVSADLEAELDLDGLADLEGEELSLEPDIDAEMEDLETSLSEEALVEDLGDAVAELSTTFIESAEDITEESVDEPASSDVDDDDEFDFLADTDEVATKLDLARAYIDMGDTDGAKDILGEVVLEGSDEQQKEANSLLERV